MRLVLLLTLVALAIALSASAQSVNWVQYINPTDSGDSALGVCLFGDHLAVVGEADDRDFVALLDRNTSKVVKMWVGERGSFYNCLSIGDRLYAVGDKGVYIFDSELNVVKKVVTEWVPRAVTFDGSYLYIAGIVYRDIDGDGDSEWIWRIEKRTLDLDLVAYREYYRGWNKTYGYHSDAYDIAINPATGELWVVGEWGLVNRTTRGIVLDYSLLMIFDKGLNVKRVVEYPEGHENNLEELWGICFDKEDNAYVIGYFGVARFDKSGNLVAVSKKVEHGVKISCAGDRVYALGERYVGNYWRHVLYVFDKGLNLLDEHILSKGVEAHSYFALGRPAFDGRSLYVAGGDYALGWGNGRIVVYSIQTPSMIRIVVQVVDGFGQPRDWPVEIDGVVSGVGRVEAEVVEGQRYVARATGLGFTNTTVFTAKGPQMVVTIKIPTAKITAQVKDGFGRVRSDWPVEVIGVASGKGSVEAEVLAGLYTVKTVVLGREFTQTVTLRAGETQTVAVHVPTAKLSVDVVDESGASVGQVESVEVDGPTSFTSTTPPKDVEVLAGQYTVRVRAFGREATAAVSLSSGEVKTVKVVVPTTQSQPTAASPTTPATAATPTATQTATTSQTEPIQQPATAPPPHTPPPTIPPQSTTTPTDFLLAGVAAAVVAVAGVLAARLRGRSAEPRKAQSTTQTVPWPQVGEGGVVGDFCLEYPGGVIPLSSYTVVGRGDFSGLPERVLEMIDERHFAVYYRDGVWWVEDLGSRYGTYLNGVRVKKERLREGDVISPGAAVAVVFKRCGTARRVVPMEDDTQLWK